eukprot:335830_1
MAQSITSSQEIASIVSEYGLKCKIVDDINSVPENTARINDIVYISKFPKVDIDRNDFSNEFRAELSTVGITKHSTYDAILVYKGGHTLIRYDFCTKLTIKKFLNDPRHQFSSCCVCYTELFSKTAKSGVPHCVFCNVHLCFVCFVKLALSDSNIDKIYQKHAGVIFKCPQCRHPTSVNILTAYYKVMDELDQFSLKQRNVILFIKQNDLCYAEKMKALTKISENRKIKNKQKSNDDKQASHFQKGQIVVLHGLNKSEWNGKHASIIGNVVVGQYRRWPVQLKSTKSERALIKQQNLRSIAIHKT